MASFPLFFFTATGRLPLGTICKEVPKVRLRSAFLKGENFFHKLHAG